MPFFGGIGRGRYPEFKKIRGLPSQEVEIREESHLAWRGVARQRLGRSAASGRQRWGRLSHNSRSVLSVYCTPDLSSHTRRSYGVRRSL